MASVLKSNKNLISKIIKDIEKCIKNERNWNNLNLDVVVNDAWKARVSMQFTFEARLKAIEEDGIVYIGLDLTSPKKLSYNPSHYRNSYEEILVDRAFPYYYSKGDEELAKFIGVSSRDEIMKDLSVLEPAVRILDSKVQDILSSFKAEVELRDGMFPRLKNRQFLPIFILDPSKGGLNYCKDSRAVNSRQGRMSKAVSDYTEDTASIATRRTVTYTYCKVKITHPFMGVYTY